MTIQELTEARDKAKTDLIAAYAILKDGREVHIGHWEKAYTNACEVLAAEQLNEAHWRDGFEAAYDDALANERSVPRGWDKIEA